MDHVLRHVLHPLNAFVVMQGNIHVVRSSDQIITLYKGSFDRADGIYQCVMGLLIGWGYSRDIQYIIQKFNVSLRNDQKLT